MGILMAKAMNIAIQITAGAERPKTTPYRSHSEWLAWSIITSMLNVCLPVAGSVTLKYRASMDNRSSTLPARVYRKNLMAAYSFRGPPQIPIRKYIGSSMISQNT